MHDETLQPGPGPSLSVLVVEDEFLIAMDVEMILKASGHSVLGPASSIEAALGLLEEARPDVALLDINLRGVLVFPVAERLRHLDIPFVLASAYRSLDFDGSEAVANANWSPRRNARSGCWEPTSPAAPTSNPLSAVR